jgi:hypothetical protein
MFVKYPSVLKENFYLAVRLFSMLGLLGKGMSSTRKAISQRFSEGVLPTPL